MGEKLIFLSAVAIGTAFEKLTALTLKPIGMNLVRVGGSGDKGIDLIGTWTLPNSLGFPSIPVMIQCKKESK